MFKKLTPVLICLFLFSAQFGFGQSEPRIGFKGGVSIATIIKSGDNTYSTDPLIGFNGGVVFQLPLGNIVGIQPELLFSQKGYHTSGTVLGNDYDYRKYLDFLDIPILLRFNFSKEFGLVVGPQYSYLLGTHTRYKSGETTVGQDVSNDNNNIRKNILGGVIGADINLTRFVFLYGRYTIDFQNNNGDGTSTTPVYKNQVFQVGIGVLL